ncbi:hypothetical protein TYRP_015592 [Tyrophagus putrescentiae]|nr:hypothetical protein TYRP_015592 [Tyrophagus putrescentiae]
MILLTGRLGGVRLGALQVRDVLVDLRRVLQVDVVVDAQVLKVGVPQRLRENGVVELGREAGGVRIGNAPFQTTATTSRNAPTKSSSATHISALMSVENGGLKLKQVLAGELLDKVGRDQAPAAVEQLSVVEAVLVDAAKDEDKVAADERHLGVRILIRATASAVLSEGSELERPAPASTVTFFSFWSSLFSTSLSCSSFSISFSRLRSGIFEEEAGTYFYQQRQSSAALSYCAALVAEDRGGVAAVVDLDAVLRGDDRLAAAHDSSGRRGRGRRGGRRGADQVVPVTVTITIS